MIFSTFIICLLSACEGRRDFPALVENGVTIDNTDILLISGDTVNIVARFQPNVNPQRNYLWEVDDPSVADVKTNSDMSVTITGKESGETTLRITSQDSENLTAETNLKVISSAPINITNQGTLTVNRENGGGPTAGEGSPKLVDGDFNTKYLATYLQPFWMTLQFDEPHIVNIYRLTSGNDAPSRDPLDWQIQGSNDGENWDVLDERTAEAFSSRNLTREFYFPNDTAYTYYRLDVLNNNGAGLFQMSEWEVFAFPE